jgi:hypothetical protein
VESWGGGYLRVNSKKMKIIRHDAYIGKRKRNAKLIALVGFLMLTGTLFLAILPNFLLPSYVLMLFGFVLFNIGMQQVGKWTRNPRNDQVLDHQLKALPDRFTIVHYAPVGKKRVEHILVHPGGALVVTAKEVDGVIDEKRSKWRRKSGGMRRFLSFSGPQLGNPSIETDTAIGNLEAFLTANQFEVDVEGAIVFVHPQTELNIEEPDFPVLHGEELAAFVTGLPADDSLTSKDREQLVELLKAGEIVEAPVTTVRRRPVKRRAA